MSAELLLSYRGFFQTGGQIERKIDVFCQTLNRSTTGVQIRVRQNTEPNVEQRRLLLSMGLKWNRNQRIGRWPEGEEVKEVVTKKISRKN